MRKKRLRVYKTNSNASRLRLDGRIRRNVIRSTWKFSSSADNHNID